MFEFVLLPKGADVCRYDFSIKFIYYSLYYVVFNKIKYILINISRYEACIYDFEICIIRIYNWEYHIIIYINSLVDVMDIFLIGMLQTSNYLIHKYTQNITMLQSIQVYYI